jgi:hypothetical protein
MGACAHASCARVRACVRGTSVGVMETMCATIHGYGWCRRTRRASVRASVRRRRRRRRIGVGVHLGPSLEWWSFVFLCLYVFDDDDDDDDDDAVRAAVVRARCVAAYSSAASASGTAARVGALRSIISTPAPRTRALSVANCAYRRLWMIFTLVCFVAARAPKDWKANAPTMPHAQMPPTTRSLWRLMVSMASFQSDDDDDDDDDAVAVADDPARALASDIAPRCAAPRESEARVPCVRGLSCV